MERFNESIYNINIMDNLNKKDNRIYFQLTVEEYNPYNTNEKYDELNIEEKNQILRNYISKIKSKITSYEKLDEELINFYVDIDYEYLKIQFCINEIYDQNQFAGKIKVEIVKIIYNNNEYNTLIEIRNFIKNNIPLFKIVEINNENFKIPAFYFVFINYHLTNNTMGKIDENIRSLRISENINSFFTEIKFIQTGNNLNLKIQCSPDLIPELRKIYQSDLDPNNINIQFLFSENVLVRELYNKDKEVKKYLFVELTENMSIGNIYTKKSNYEESIFLIRDCKIKDDEINKYICIKRITFYVMEDGISKYLTHFDYIKTPLYKDKYHSYLEKFIKTFIGLN
ncbi:MAG: hypothetical protein ACTSRZ_08280 [Promethearchaeota archaeon]